MLVDVCIYGRKVFCFSCLLQILLFLLTLPDPPRINVDGMICN